MDYRDAERDAREAGLDDLVEAIRRRMIAGQTADEAAEDLLFATTLDDAQSAFLVRLGLAELADRIESAGGLIS